MSALGRATVRAMTPQAALGTLVLAGIALRLVAIISWWPVSPTLADSWPYAVYAGTNPLADPQHPAGYPIYFWPSSAS